MNRGPDDTPYRDKDGRPVALDDRGYLLDPAQWNEDLAEAMARADDLALGQAHWRVLRWLRGYHERHGRSPAMRVLVKELAAELGSEHADSRQLYRLFPQGPAKQAARYAGLPRPASCI
jgi:tRNA 2-thiouridine synthesizing protein E